jgi:sodium/potassium-transporting ATPase subunit alpha
METRSMFKLGTSVDGQPAKMLFNSTHKYALSIVINPVRGSYYTVFIKGAPEKLWTYCSGI